MKILLGSILVMYGSIGIGIGLLLLFLRPRKKKRVVREAEKIAYHTYHGPLIRMAPPVVRSTEQKKVIAWAWDYVEKMKL